MTRYVQAELRAGLGPAPLFGLLFGLALIGASQWIMPRVPESAIALLGRSYHLDGLGPVMLLNDLLAVSTVLFFVGVSQLAAVIVTPREERQLDLLLSKPVSPTTFLAARTLPALASTLVLGTLLSAACALAMVPYAGGQVSASIGFATSLGVTAITLVQLAVASLVYVRVTDGFQALLVAFALWLTPLLPTSIYLYRPDLFTSRPGLAEGVVMPANLIWLGSDAMLVALSGIGVAGVVAAIALGLGGGMLGRMELR